MKIKFFTLFSFFFLYFLPGYAGGTHNIFLSGLVLQLFTSVIFFYTNQFFLFLCFLFIFSAFGHVVQDRNDYQGYQG